MKSLSESTPGAQRIALYLRTCRDQGFEWVSKKTLAEKVESILGKVEPYITELREVAGFMSLYEDSRWYYSFADKEISDLIKKSNEWFDSV